MLDKFPRRLLTLIKTCRIILIETDIAMGNGPIETRILESFIVSGRSFPSVQNGFSKEQIWPIMARILKISIF